MNLKAKTFKTLAILTVSLFALIFAITNLTSCSKSTSSSTKNTAFYTEDFAQAQDYEVEESAVAAPRMMMAKSASSNIANDFSAQDIESAQTADADFQNPSSSNPNSIENKNSSETFERKLIKNGDLTLQVENLDEIEQKIETWCKSYGGYISSSNQNERSLNFTIKIPSQKFDSAMEEAGNFGILKSKNISTRDVTEQFYDLQTRLSTKKILQSNLQNYLRQATNLTDILKIEKELNNVTSDLESMQGQMRRLSNQIEFSTINIYLRLPDYKSEIREPSFSENFTNFLHSLKTFFAGFLTILLYVIICGIPILAILALLYWLLFGKIGLIKKLFKKLK